MDDVAVVVVSGAGVGVVVCKLSKRDSTGAGVATAEVVASITGDGIGVDVVFAMRIPPARDSKGAGGCDEHATKPSAPKISPKKCIFRIFCPTKIFKKVFIVSQKACLIVCRTTKAQSALLPTAFLQTLWMCNPRVLNTACHHHPSPLE